MTTIPPELDARFRKAMADAVRQAEAKAEERGRASVLAGLQAVGTLVKTMAPVPVTDAKDELLVMLFKKAFDESKHPRDYGKFSEKEGSDTSGGGRFAASSPSDWHHTLPEDAREQHGDDLESYADDLHDAVQEDVADLEGFAEKKADELHSAGAAEIDLEGFDSISAIASKHAEATGEKYRKAAFDYATAQSELESAKEEYRPVGSVRSFMPDWAPSPPDKDSDDYEGDMAIYRQELAEAEEHAREQRAKAKSSIRQKLKPLADRLEDAKSIYQKRREKYADAIASGMLRMRESADKIAGGLKSESVKKSVYARKAFNPRQPRDDAGRWVDTSAIKAASKSPAKAEALRKKVNDPEQRKELDAAIADPKILGRPKKGTVQHTVGIAHKLSGKGGDARQKHLEKLHAALSGHTKEELAEFKKHLGIKAGGKKAELVDKLVERAGMIDRSDASKFVNDRVSLDDAEAALKAHDGSDASLKEITRTLSHGLTHAEFRQLAKRMEARVGGTKWEMARKLAKKVAEEYADADDFNWDAEPREKGETQAETQARRDEQEATGHSFRELEAEKKRTRGETGSEVPSNAELANFANSGKEWSEEHPDAFDAVTVTDADVEDATDAEDARVKVPEVAKDSRATVSASEPKPTPSQSDIESHVLDEFHRIHDDEHSTTGLVPIHKIRDSVRAKFGDDSATHTALDPIFKDLRRRKLLGMMSISDRSRATPEELENGVRGVGESFHYFEKHANTPARGQRHVTVGDIEDAGVKVSEAVAPTEKESSPKPTGAVDSPTTVGNTNGVDSQSASPKPEGGKMDGSPHIVMGQTFKNKDAIKASGGKFDGEVWTIPADKVVDLPAGLTTRSVVDWESENLPSKSVVGSRVIRQNGNAMHRGTVERAANVSVGGRPARFEVVKVDPNSDGFTHMLAGWTGDQSGRVRYQLYKSEADATAAYDKSLANAGGAV